MSEIVTKHSKSSFLILGPTNNSERYEVILSK